MNVMNPAGPMPVDSMSQMGDRSETPSVGMSSEFRIRRVGGRPIVFRGSELAMSMSFTPEIPYWYEMNIYRTQSQRFVLAVRVFFQSADEEDYVRAWEFDDLSDVFDAIEGYDAAQDVKMTLPAKIDTLPPAALAAHALELQAKVSAARAHYQGLVGELFAEIESKSA
ncbi:hypothetical protein RGUI_4053 [Rhodovulum sp. P5]|uniref:hypothetical protein n=1 Tax=Rhodovulum sp. P5 TaxID=1564506 RepID=UPI0009C2B3E8|nr:hypothetical protein [Rhodovulum sp. P5]ARE42194.1 hypothetical protein RGUI_4053 [Rhodovulum sp. P5]